jgi:hypothetical protein
VAKRRNRRNTLVNEIRIYFEGDDALRPGFRAFFREIWDMATARRCKVQLIAGEGAAAQDFKIALKDHPHARNILVIDSEGPHNAKLAADFCRKHRFPRRSVFWMVQVMESWFLADGAALRSYYGAGFNESALPRNPKVEEVPKQDVLKGIEQAIRQTKKRKYHKTRQAPDLLARIDPSQVRKAAPNCERIFRTLLAACENG